MEVKISFDKAVELLKAGKYPESLKIMEDLVKRFPDEPDFISERGVIKFHLKDMEGALKDMDEAVRLQPMKSYRYSSRAYILGHAGLTQKAIKDYQKAIELDPEDAVAHNNLGLLEEKLGYEEKAKRRFEIADSIVNSGGVDGRKDQEILGKALEGRNIQKEIEDKQKEANLWTTIKSIGTAEGRSSFMKFLRSGFKQT